MDNTGKEGKPKKVPANIDTTITETKFVENYTGKAFRKADSIGQDADGGIVNKITVEILRDACGEPITSKEQISGNCKVCRRIIKKGNGVRCEGRCGELLDLRCYQKQGAHTFHGRRFCRWDYWTTRIFWQWISPSLRREKIEVSSEEKKQEHPELEILRNALRNRRYMRPSQPQDR